MSQLPKRIDIYRRMTPQQRLQVGFDLNRLARVLLRLKLRHQFVDWSENQLIDEVNRRMVDKLADDPEIECMCTRLCEEFSS
jgi:hypothetical protein